MQRWRTDGHLDQAAVVEGAVQRVLARLQATEPVLPDNAPEMARACGWQALAHFGDAHIELFLPVLVEHDILTCLLDGCAAAVDDKA